MGARWGGREERGSGRSLELAYMQAKVNVLCGLGVVSAVTLCQGAASCTCWGGGLVRVTGDRCSAGFAEVRGRGMELQRRRLVCRVLWLKCFSFCRNEICGCSPLCS